MHINVIHLLGLQVGIAQRIQHHAIPTLAFLGRLGNVVSVGAHAVADNFGHDVGSTASREFQLLKNQDARTLADDEAIPIHIKGSTRSFRTIVTRRKRTHGRESSDSHGSDGSLSAACDHHIGVIASDNFVSVTN